MFIWQEVSFCNETTQTSVIQLDYLIRNTINGKMAQLYGSQLFCHTHNYNDTSK